MEQSKYYCEQCGTILSITKKLIGFDPNTGKSLFMTTWRCPYWHIFSRHTKVSGENGFDSALQTRNCHRQAWVD